MRMIMVEEKKVKKSWYKRLSNIGGGILFGLVALLIVFQFVGIATQAKNHGIPNYGGFMSFRVKTNSMEKDKKFNVGTMIFVVKTAPEKLKKGDVITFLRSDKAAYGDNAGAIDPFTREPYIITHRITEVEEYNGAPAFRTLGDNLFAQTCPVGGCSYESSRDFVKASDVLGKVIGENRALGYLNKTMTEKPFVMVILVLIPLLFVFSSSLVDLIKQIKAGEKEEALAGGAKEIDGDFEAMKEAEKLRIMIEMEKDRMRQGIVDGELTEPPVEPRKRIEDPEFESIKEQEKLRLMIEIEKEKMRKEMEAADGKDKK